ncbi:MAG: hypothetical protein WCO86_07755, partial [Planctomycetota bacterium]
LPGAERGIQLVEIGGTGQEAPARTQAPRTRGPLMSHFEPQDDNDEQWLIDEGCVVDEGDPEVAEEEVQRAAEAAEADEREEEEQRRRLEADDGWIPDEVLYSRPDYNVAPTSRRGVRAGTVGALAVGGGLALVGTALVGGFVGTVGYVAHGQWRARQERERRARQQRAAELGFRISPRQSSGHDDLPAA